MDVLNRPTLSVFMANYNHGKYLPRAIEAIATQSYAPDEYIILDDGSTDDSVEVIRRYVNRYPFIRFERNQENKGILSNVKRLLEMTTGDYIYSAAADDFVLPGFFEKSMQMLARYPEAGLCCSDPVWLDERTGLTRVTRLGWSPEPCYLPSVKLADRLHGGYIPGHSSIVKRSALSDAGGYLPKLRWHCDWFASLVIAFRHGICYVPEPLATLTAHDTSYSAARRWARREQQEIVDQVLRLLKSPTYRDVLPFFCQSNVLAHFGPDVVRVVLANPGHWDLRTLYMARRPILRGVNSLRSRAWCQTKLVVSRATPQFVKRAFFRLSSFTPGAA